MFLRSSMPSKANIRVSIAMITYNHERFIEKALDSVIMQKTNFAYQVVIGEDCSTDKTRKIVLDYQKRYPDKILVLLNERNLGMHKNSTRVLKACKGRYVAYLEGDDYWASPDKLQKQVDYMDSHPECSMSFHDVSVVYDYGTSGGPFLAPQDRSGFVGVEDTTCRALPPAPDWMKEDKEFIEIEDLLWMNTPIATCSSMFRRDLCGELPDWVDSLKMRDWPAIILAAQRGKIGCIHENLGVYVIHSGGVWQWYRQNWGEEQKARIELWHALRAHLDQEHRSLVDVILRYQFFIISQGYEAVGHVSEARAYIVRSLAKHAAINVGALRQGPGSFYADSMPDGAKFFSSRELIRTFLRLYAPPLLKIYGHMRRLCTGTSAGYPCR